MNKLKAIEKAFNIITNKGICYDHNNSIKEYHNDHTSPNAKARDQAWFNITGKTLLPQITIINTNYFEPNVKTHGLTIIMHSN